MTGHDDISEQANTGEREPTFVKILETSSQTDIAIIKSALDGEVEYYISNENVATALPYFYAALMVAEEDAPRAAEILRQFNFNVISIRLPE